MNSFRCTFDNIDEEFLNILQLYGDTMNILQLPVHFLHPFSITLEMKRGILNLRHINYT